MGQVQRVPLGLLDLLSLKDVGLLPRELAQGVQPTLELLQYYGLSQIQHFSNNNAAVAEGSAVSVVPTGTDPDPRNKWAVLFAACGIFIKTATATALRGSILIARLNANTIPVASEELGPFGATETGACDVCWVPPYPLILAPPWDVRAALKILGTDANANVTATAQIGVFG